VSQEQLASQPLRRPRRRARELRAWIGTHTPGKEMSNQEYTARH